MMPTTNPSTISPSILTLSYFPSFQLKISTNYPSQLPVSVPTNEPSFDWTTTLNDIMWPVKDQGLCSACWAFAQVASMEVAYFQKYGVLNSFSEQLLVSCDFQELGCNGGSPYRSLLWLQSNGGLTSEEEFPYSSGNTGLAGPCLTGYQLMIPPAYPSRLVKVKPLSAVALEAAIDINPVIILLQADSLVFQLYIGGIINSPSCGGSNLNHAMVAVGYGTMNGIRYIKARNQWSVYWYYFNIKLTFNSIKHVISFYYQKYILYNNWGDNGYVYIARDPVAIYCGILTFPSYPLL